MKHDRILACRGQRNPPTVAWPDELRFCAARTHRDLSAGGIALSVHENLVVAQLLRGHALDANDASR